MNDEQYMRRAMELAAGVRRATSPNPWVGSVVQPGGFEGIAIESRKSGAGSSARSARMSCTHGSVSSGAFGTSQSTSTPS